MCGIAGFYGFQNHELIKKFSQELAHRGPDGEGIYTDSQVTLLSRRLAIIDRQGGDQPIYNEDRSVVVVYNGEIYNYQELRIALEKAGHHFRTKSDTEIIVHGYEEWGDKAFDRYNGMFGIALFDIKRQRLILARDHFGIKPLYYVHPEFSDVDGIKLMFSSELKPLIYSGLMTPRVNERVLYRYLKFRVHDEGRETFFDGVHRLLPGEMMVIENGNITKSSFSSLETDLAKAIQSPPRATTMGNQTATFNTHFQNAVKSRLISEVPVGTCLSGGLDSSLVVAIVNELLKHKSIESASVGTVQNTFSAVFPGSVNDEERYIDELLKNCSNIASHKVCPKPQEFIADLSDFIKTQEEPTISTGPYAQYRVMQMAHKKVTVLLDGQGADEMLGGYIPYIAVYLRQLWKEQQYSTFFAELIYSWPLLRKNCVFWIKNRLKRFYGITSHQVLKTPFQMKFANETFTVCQDNLKKRLADDIFKNSLQSLLRYEDRNTMRFSIEGRVPFLDVNLVRFVFSLPDSSIIRTGYNKFILRESSKNILPDLIRLRKNKIGFTTPEHEWFLQLKKEIYEIFLSQSFAMRPYFNQKEVLRAFREFTLGGNDDTLLFWRLINVELWMREFIDPGRQGVRATGSQGDRESGRQSGLPNTGKHIEIEIGAQKYCRYPIRTELFAKGDDYAKKISDHVRQFLLVWQISTGRNVSVHKKWYVVISEKIVAISQGRSFFIWDIKPSWWATILSQHVMKTPSGIGLGSPWTMQIALNEVGLMRILMAAAVSIISKPFGLKGMFYKVAGSGINAIDGPTEYSLYPSNVSAKLPPKDPQSAAESIEREVRQMLRESGSQEFRDAGAQMLRSSDAQAFRSSGEQDGARVSECFGGVVIIDANDIGRNVLGNASDKANSFFEDVMRDNPMGQGSEQTPLVLLL